VGAHGRVGQEPGRALSGCCFSSDPWLSVAIVSSHSGWPAFLTTSRCRRGRWWGERPLLEQTIQEMLDVV
jgi:hypothetical protein